MSSESVSDFQRDSNLRHDESTTTKIVLHILLKEIILVYLKLLHCHYFFLAAKKYSVAHEVKFSLKFATKSKDV